MKTLIYFFSAIIMLTFIFSCSQKKSSVEPAKVDVSEFLGQWTLDIEGGTVGWLEVRQEERYLDADLLWVAGSVTPVANVFLAADQFLVVTRTSNVIRKRDEAGQSLRTHVITNWLEVRKDGEDKLTGYLLNPRRNGLGVDSTAFTGKKLPPVPPAPDLSKVKYGEPIVLFNGKDLTGWRLVNEKQTNGFKVVDGILVNDPVQPGEGEKRISYGNIRTEQEFEDFNLKLEVNVPQGSNSGVYLRGMYEIQVSDSYKRPLDSHNMGALYSRITPSVNAEKPAGEWQSLDITLCERHLTVILNGVKIIDNQPVYGPTGGAIKSDVFAPGPIYLQGDHGKVMYRNIVLTPIIK
ncbi:MAG: 3-keto-disaccharide hydrolase [Bacteroidales bacterium]